jgi:hypothetical protein
VRQAAVFVATLILAAISTVGHSELLIYLPFDDANADTVSDQSGNGLVGEIIDGATVVDGPYGSALDFENGFIDFGDQPELRRSSGITLEAWITVRDPQPNQFAAGVPYRDTTSWSSPWVGHQIGVEKGQFLSWLSIDSTNRQFGGGTIDPNVWYHIAMTYDGTWRRSYLNGDEVFASDAETGDTVFEGSPHFVVGSHSVHSPGEFFGGAIDEVAMYSEVLSEDQIRRDMDGIFEQSTAVEPRGKIATAWAALKAN